LVSKFVVKWQQKIVKNSDGFSATKSETRNAHNIDDASDSLCSSLFSATFVANSATKA
jgi:hypothetical protein